MSTKNTSKSTTQRSPDAVQTSFSLRRSTLKKLKAAAAADQRSASNMVNVIVDEYFARLEAEARAQSKAD